MNVISGELGLDFTKQEMDFPFNPDMQADVIAHGKLKKYSAETIIFREGEAMDMIPILVRGRVRMFHRNEDLDRELLLYSVEEDEECMLACVTFFKNNKLHRLHAVAELDTVLLFMPYAIIKKWEQTHIEWTTMILKSFRHRVEGLCDTIKSLSMSNLECRILHYLNERAKEIGSPIIYTTHKFIASDLATTRVVVSRILKTLEKKGEIRMMRGQVEIIAQENH